MYFRLMLIGLFEGIDSERGIAWRVADFVVLAAIPAHRPGRADPGPRDDLTDAAADGRSYTPGSIRMGAATSGAGGMAERENNRHRRNDAGGQCGHEVDRTARHAGKLHGVPQTFGGSRRVGGKR